LINLAKGRIRDSFQIRINHRSAAIEEIKAGGAMSLFSVTSLIPIWRSPY
jgi:hypothetical protein